jgi:hypothetical protein
MSSNTNTGNYNQRDQRDQRDYGRDGERGRKYGGNRERYIPREREEDRDDRPRQDREPRRDAYYDSYVGQYGENVARNIYGEDKTPITHPSICIPRTFTSIRGKPTKAAVFNTMRDLKVGHIDRIDVVQKTDARGERYCTIYVHLEWNVRNQLARDTRQKLLDGNDVKIVYDDPWFWKCTMSTMEKPDREGGDGGRSAPKPRIDLGDGVKAMSKYSRDEQRSGYGGGGAAAATDEQEHHDQRQLCNMDPSEESDDN